MSRDKRKYGGSAGDRRREKRADRRRRMKSVYDTPEPERERIIADYIARKMTGAMKIICVDNFNRDTHGDSLIAENVPPFYADKIADFLNSRFSSGISPEYYKAVPDNHELHKGHPEG